MSRIHASFPRILALMALSGQIRTGELRSAAPQSCTLTEEVAFSPSGTSGAFSQLQQPVTTRTDGGFATVWLQGAPGSRVVRLQWIDASGRILLGRGGRVITTDPSDHFNPIITASTDGGAFVASVGGNSVLVQRFDAAGLPLWPGDGVPAFSSDLPLAAVDPSLVADGTAVFVCAQLADYVGGWDIRCQRLTSAGKSQWGPGGYSASGGWAPDLRVLPRAITDDSGGLLVFWRNHRDPYSTEVVPMLMAAAEPDSLYELPCISESPWL